ncbi:hypothetical protein B0H10DRAFT_2278296 [Mycena sp. CBHHK59/15]|nr:hypothetical protein B0H10DRAFT_2278296 [Mycena sp. CBHHK59/15]
MENNGYTLGRFNFPPSQYLVPPPVPYLPPEQFYGHPMPFYPAGAAIDASEMTDLSTHKRAGSDAEAPRPGSVEKGPSEKTRVFTFILGLDTEGKHRFNQHKTNPGRVYKQASEIKFEGDRSPDSTKSMFERNGGGDADSDDPTAILKSKLSAARKAGLPIGGLSPAKILEWEKNGWSDLFNNCFGTSAKVSQAAVRNSATPISDNDSGDDSDIYIHPELRKPAPRVQQTPAATVSEPKHTPSLNFRKQVTHSFGNLGEIMKMKMVSEEKKVSVLESRLNLDREKLEMDKTKGKVEMAHKVLSTPGASDEVKEAANAWLLTVFSM